MTRIAVVGAGLAGLVVAKTLAREYDVTVFEKSRGVGGRIATRYAGKFEFDHGAQFFTVKSAAFREFLEPLIEQQVVVNWPARFAELEFERVTATRQWDDRYPHYVGAPRMNALGQSLALDLDVRLTTAVSELRQHGDGWRLVGDGQRDLGAFDWVVSTAPAPQTATLLPHFSRLRVRCDAATMRSCFALMLGFDAQVNLPFDAALVRAADISWISVNSSKPGRAAPCCLVVHSTNAWADAHLDDDADSVARHLLSECSAVTGIDVEAAAHCRLHRWRFANIDSQSGPDHFIDADSRIAACGDWFVRGRIEAAFTSATALCHSLVRHM